MKKGIVLITSIFFISLISLLILENIKYTEMIHKENNADLINTQMMLSIMDFEKEIAKLLKNISSKKINTWLSTYSEIQIPLYDHVNVKMYFTKLEDIYSLNDIGKGKSIEKNIKDFFLEYDVNYYSFTSFYKNYIKNRGNRVINTKQVNKIIKDYKKTSSYEDIAKIEKQLSFFSVKNDDFYILCKLEFDIKGKIFATQFIYDKKKEEIKEETFEIVFK